MSNFNCTVCGMPILEDENGRYYTECIHYPLEDFKKKNIKDIENDDIEFLKEYSKTMRANYKAQKKPFEL